MDCHECLMAGREKAAVALCRFCLVGLCKDHLVEAYQDPPTVPAYSCTHQPARYAGERRASVGAGEKKWLRTSA